MAIEHQSERTSQAIDYNYETFSLDGHNGTTRGFKDALRAGDQAPDFNLPTPDGDHIRLSDFRGQKHVLLEFGSIT